MSKIEQMPRVESWDRHLDGDLKTYHYLEDDDVCNKEGLKVKPMILIIF